MLLDINQKASSSKLSLDELRVYTGSTGNLSGYNATTKQLTGATLVYDMGDNWVKLDARLNTGSGSGDMLFYVPLNVLGGADQYLYVYSKFGVNIAANGGFEEWATGPSTSLPPPETGAAVSSLAGTVFLDGDADGTFESRIGNARILLYIDLNGDGDFTDEGEQVDEVLSASDGTYAFNNLLIDGQANFQVVIDLNSVNPAYFSVAPDTLAGTVHSGENLGGLDFFFRVSLGE